MKRVSLPQNVFREILKGIAGPVFRPFHKVEETVGHFFEPQVLLDAGGTAFIVLCGVKGTGEVRTRTERDRFSITASSIKGIVVSDDT